VPDPVVANLIVLVVVLVLPFISENVERNLEPFLFVMGVISALASGVLTLHLMGEAARDPIPITAAVFISGLLFALARPRLVPALRRLLQWIGPAVLSAVAVALLGLASSVITAMIASLVLVEFIAALQLRRADEVRVVVLACFAIGLGAALTPVGEPLATIAVAKLDQDFWFLARLLGPWILPGVLAVGVGTAALKLQPAGEGLTREAERSEWYIEVVGRAARVYLFVMGLTLLGEGFRPLIDRFVIGLDARLLYWINMISAILDNATLTAAEISPRMTNEQVRAVLMGLLISGGMLIPGNIPNIIAAGKLSIRSREWARVAVPIGAVLLVVYFALLFLVT
jgi:predicted cation transporter